MARQSVYSTGNEADALAVMKALETSNIEATLRNNIGSGFVGPDSIDVLVDEKRFDAAIKIVSDMIEEDETEIDQTENVAEVEFERYTDPKSNIIVPTVEDTNGWYYNLKNGRVGPVNSKVISNLLASGDLSNDSLLWREGFTDWKKVSDTEFKLSYSGPPPLVGEGVNNTLVWIVAFLPIVGALVQYSIALNLGGSINSYWWITFVMNIVFCFADAGILKSAGHDTKKFGFWAILVPVYLFLRKKALKQSVAYFVVWLVCFGVSLFL